MTDDTRVFLGGTVSDSKWREWMMERLDHIDGVSYYNPVVPIEELGPDFNKIYEQKLMDSHVKLFVFSPRMKAFFTLFEVMRSVFELGGTTIFCALKNDSIHYDHYGIAGPIPHFAGVSWQSLVDIGDELNKRGCAVCYSLEDALKIIKALNTPIEITNELLDELFEEEGQEKEKEKENVSP